MRLGNHQQDDTTHALVSHDALPKCDTLLCRQPHQYVLVSPSAPKSLALAHRAILLWYNHLEPDRLLPGYSDRKLQKDVLPLMLVHILLLLVYKVLLLPHTFLACRKVMLE